jgi:dTDP-glucose 4,6-dehydratase
MSSKSFFITGGAGFIGSNLVHHLLAGGDDARVVVLDALTYAGNLRNLEAFERDARFNFVRGDVCDGRLVRELYETHRPDVVFNLAAESHVDRSIDDAADFVRTNVHGTYELLDAARAHHAKLSGDARARFRFVHVSTDEVFGSLGATGAFDEDTRYDPRSPYAASKASADHLARAWFHTYGLPTIVTNCSNNYGPYQFPEKLIPLVTLNALEGKPLPVYGDGKNVRDWLWVGDHCDALVRAASKGAPGATYCIGGRQERTTLQVVEGICDALSALRPDGDYRRLITMVTDRPGHDRRYAIDPSKAERELGWKPTRGFEAGLRETVAWYLKHLDWCDEITSGRYSRERLGLASVAS